MTKEELVETISNMTVLEVSELVKELEEKFGVSAAAPVAMAAAPAAEAAPVEEQTLFEVELKEIGSQKIQTIKVLREFTDLGLKEAKEFVESAPKVFKGDITKEEAEKIKARFAEVGAKVDIK